MITQIRLFIIDKETESEATGRESNDIHVNKAIIKLY